MQCGAGFGLALPLAVHCTTVNDDRAPILAAARSAVHQADAGPKAAAALHRDVRGGRTQLAISSMYSLLHAACRDPVLSSERPFSPKPARGITCSATGAQTQRALARSRARPRTDASFTNMRLTTTAVLCLMGVQAVHAHMQLVLPPAINSKSDPQTPEPDMYVPTLCTAELPNRN